MNVPRGLAYDSTNSRLFVGQETGNRVSVFDVTAITNGENAINVLGQPDFTTNTAATTQEGMSSTQGLAYDNINNRLFVAQEGNHRITVFDVTSITDGESAVNVIGQSDFTSMDSATSQKGLNNPKGLFYDSILNRLFVADQINNRISIYDLSDTTITSISAPSNTYKQGDIIPISITFNKVVNVTGTPTLTLETGETDQIASYSSGSGTDTLVFNYEVQKGDLAEGLDYTATDALSLNGGTILDLYNGLPIFTLPIPGETGSLSNTSDVNVIIPNRSSGSSASSRYTNLVSMGKTDQANDLLKQYPDQINPINTTPNPNPSTEQVNPNPSPKETTPIITRTLKLSSTMMTGDDIKTLQTYLNSKGYDCGLIDGIFGNKTKQAVIKFQIANGLKGDGIVGPLTRAMIK